MYVLIIILLILLVIYILYNYCCANIYVKSQIDGREYSVRPCSTQQEASNILAQLRQNMIALSDYLYKQAMQNNKNIHYVKYKNYITQLNNKIQHSIIEESTIYSRYTSYSVNKGELLVFCLRPKNDNNKLYDINLLMYVASHEMAHIACPEYGHPELFIEIFAFIVKQAIKINLYKYIDFDKNPVEYGGLLIENSVI